MQLYNETNEKSYFSDQEITVKERTNSKLDHHAAEHSHALLLLTVGYLAYIIKPLNYIGLSNSEPMK